MEIAKCINHQFDVLYNAELSLGRGSYALHCQVLQSAYEPQPFAVVKHYLLLLHYQRIESNVITQWCAWWNDIQPLSRTATYASICVEITITYICTYSLLTKLMVYSKAQLVLLELKQLHAFGSHHRGNVCFSPYCWGSWGVSELISQLIRRGSRSSLVS